MRLIDADKLDARLSRDATPYYTQCDIDNAPTIDPSSLRPKGEWISVEDRLPESSCEVVIMRLDDERETVISVVNTHYSHKYKLFNSYDWFTQEEVKKCAITVDYWMPMPEPPRGEA